MNDSIIASRLKILRGKKTQQEIATALGITKSAWAMYERGERMPRDEIKIKIADYFGSTVQELFFDGTNYNYNFGIERGHNYVETNI